MPKALPAAVLGLLAAVSLGLAAAGCASQPPALAQEWYDIGNVWFDKKDWKKAADAYSKALGIDGDFPGAAFNLARALASAGDYEGSLRRLDALARADPGNVRVTSARAYALYKLGFPQAALTAYRDVLARDPYAPDAVYNVAILELATGDASAAAAHFEQLSLNAPDDKQILLYLGKARDARGDEEGALEAFERAEVLGASDAGTLERMGQIYEAGRRFKNAMDSYEAAVKAEPGRAGAWFALARLRLSVASDSERGIEALDSALAAGFSDKKAAAELMDEPDLVAREKAHDLLKAKGLVVD